jgi:hypothetical protein
MSGRDDFDHELRKLLKSTPALGRYRAIHALQHLEKASLIAEIDPEMTAFRGITAEEEAAAAVFHALVRRKYNGARYLNARNHVHKSAVIPFCDALSDVFAPVIAEYDLNPELFISKKEDQPKLRLRFSVAGLGLGNLNAEPEPPLHFSIRRPGGELIDFKEQLQKFADFNRADSVLEYVERRANERNQLLYATDGGIPSIRLDNFLELQRSRVRRLLIIYMMVDPYPQHQSFVSQALLSFLTMLRRLPKSTAS